MSQPVVRVEQGQIKGKVGVNSKGGSYFSFQGIPYGKAPIGDLRFKAPLPAEPWNGILDATKEGSESLSKHMLFDHNIGSEDCLFLNVFTPQLPNAEKKPLLPVMVFIHGGGFICGSGSSEIYGPEFLVAEDIILITINYRLGILGFLSLEDTSLGVPGNAGLKDTVLALKWVQKNIAQFNGDSNNVTIFGESAGSAACQFLTLSPLAKGLFHRAILQSGVTLNPWALGTRSGFLIAKVLGHECKDEKDLLKLLDSLPAEKFLEAQELIKDSLYADEIRPFCPVIEKPHPGAFITEDPIDIILSGNYNKVPIMIGYTNREGMLLEMTQKKKNEKVEYRLPNFEKAIFAKYNIPKGTSTSLQLAKKIEDFYYGDSKSPEEDVDKFYLLWTDVFFLRGIHVTVRALLKTLDAPIYFYKFCVESNLNLIKKFANITAPGVCHADDLGYLFKCMITPEIEPKSLEDISIQRMVKFWTNFAKNGNPNPKNKDSYINIEWTPVQSENLECLEINKELSMIKNADFDRMKFWDNISASVNSKL